MKTFIQSLILGAGMLTAGFGYAQSQPAKSAAPDATTASAPIGVTVAAPARASAAKGAGRTVSTTHQAAPGGGDGKVWVNASSKTYHCPGTKYYGKTKAGEYMSESDAKAKGNHANHMKACS